MFDPKTIKRGRETVPRKVVIYGPPKMGKTTLACSSPGALLVPTEDRARHIECAKTEVVSTMEEIFEVFEYLISPQNAGLYKSLIIDTLDWMEPILHDYICRKKGFKSLNDDHNKETAFQKGLKYHAVEGWKMFLQNCDTLRLEAGISIVLVAHSDIQKVTPPDMDAYDRWSLKIDKNAVSVVEEWADVIGFYNREIIVTKEDKGFGQKRGKALAQDDKRILNLSTSSPSWISGNSYGLEDVIVTLDQTGPIMRYVLDLPEITQQAKTKKGDK